MLVEIVTAGNRHLFSSELDQHFKLRHDIYVGERRWMDLAKPDGRERDQFDNENAIYLLGIERESVIGGSRLIPTLKPHLFSEVFPHLALNGVPRCADVYEWTRVHVAKHRREGRNRGLALGSIFCGVAEYCLAERVGALTAIVEMWWLPHFHEMGWVVKPLGLPHLIESEWSIGVLLPISEEILDNTRAMFGIEQTVFAQPVRNWRQKVRASA